jgi:hypothetical protein
MNQDALLPGDGSTLKQAQGIYLVDNEQGGPQFH